MNIILAGSITACEQIEDIASKLQAMGHVVEIPFGCKHLRDRTEVSLEEKASDKIANDLLRAYFEKMKAHDAMLVVNPEKRGIAGYVGGNTLIEMSFAHVLGKPLYCLYPPGEVSYLPEILAMQPTVLDGNLSMFSSSRT